MGPLSRIPHHRRLRAGMRCGVGLRAKSEGRPAPGPAAAVKPSRRQARMSTIWPGRCGLAPACGAPLSSLISRTTLPDTASVRRNTTPPWALPTSNRMVTEAMGTKAVARRGSGVGWALGALSAATLAASARGAASPHPAGAVLVGGSWMGMVNGFWACHQLSALKRRSRVKRPKSCRFCKQITHLSYVSKPISRK